MNMVNNVRYQEKHGYCKSTKHADSVSLDVTSTDKKMSYDQEEGTHRVERRIDGWKIG